MASSRVRQPSQEPHTRLTDSVQERPSQVTHVGGRSSSNSGSSTVQTSAAVLNKVDAARWRGVSIGGWLLLEPGPSRRLFSRFRMPPKGARKRHSATADADQGPEATCEWELMEAMKFKGEEGYAALREHRDTFITRKDFELIRDMGLNAVRIPFGYWIVIGPTARDPYIGPALDYIDRAVRWAEELNLQVLLDLHGAPGGESAEAPCGRRQRPVDRWRWRRWRFRESLQALEVLTKRYRGSRVVTGIAVCNEPSPQVPLVPLCKYYGRAVQTVRTFGMDPDKVSVVLPVFQRSIVEFATQWDETVNGLMKGPGACALGDVCFEVHWYHCFENEWHGRTFAQHLRAVQEHVKELRRYPIVVGEWSLALGRGSQPGLLSHQDMRKFFAHAQLAAYREASHGWFFWSWSDEGGGADWDWQLSHREGCWPSTLDMPDQPGGFREPPRKELLSPGSDPLERILDVPASDPCIRIGDTVYLRAFNGSYFDVEGSRLRARYGDRGRWQQFVICPGSRASGGLAGRRLKNSPARHKAQGKASNKKIKLRAAAKAAAMRLRRREGFLCDGDAIRLRAHTGCFLGVNEDQTVEARWAEQDASDRACIFILHTENGGLTRVRHRSAIFLRSATSKTVLAPNEGDHAARSDIVARWDHLGIWQRLVAEKPLVNAVNPPRPRRVSVAALESRLPEPAESPTRCVPESTDAASTQHSRTLIRRHSVATPSRKRRLSHMDSMCSSPRPSGEASAALTVTTPVAAGKAGNFQATPASARRRASAASAAGNAEAGQPSVASTPLRRRRSLDGEEDELFDLASLPTPSRRRRISADGGPKELLSLLMSPVPEPAACPATRNLSHDF
eukprot:TRINITY_DN90385_c0_g1_i1.p1 TRINITY_DN90385_c0_g1~~TRINITY_DN90385_c0_g1_i1.p1  ORF type:complete len:849 (+),score=136.99 TRINITY_DN90385_c0_g1_i1:244-2790(+)